MVVVVVPVVVVVVDVTVVVVVVVEVVVVVVDVVVVVVVVVVLVVVVVVVLAAGMQPPGVQARPGSQSPLSPQPGTQTPASHVVSSPQSLLVAQSSLQLPVPSSHTRPRFSEMQSALLPQASSQVLPT